MEKNCKNCIYGSFRECHRSKDGRMLWDGDKGEYDEYNYCAGWIKFEASQWNIMWNKLRVERGLDPMH
jgi:hypothetical protein